jgi:hypothetical protein
MDPRMKPRLIEKPEPGFYKLRLARGGPWVAAIIFRPCPIEFDPETFQHVDRVYHLQAEIDGKSVELLRVWEYGRPVDQAEYEYLCGDRDWCRRHAPERLEAATPRDYFRVDLLPPIF